MRRDGVGRTVAAVFKDHFSAAAKGYAAFRPTYPDALIDLLADAAPGRAVAFDVACGTGQLSVPLARAFDRIEARDASAAQIASAEPHCSVRYGVAPAEASGLPDASVDLVVAAQAAHWFDLAAFYAEARRVGRQGAAIAIVSYATASVDDPAIAALVDHFYGQTLDPYWPPERVMVEDSYRTLPFPFDERATPDLMIEADWPLDRLIGYFDTWSAVRALERDGHRAEFDNFADTLRDAWGSPETTRRLSWPLAIRLGRL